MFARAYWVFNRDQVDDLQETDDPVTPVVNRVEALAEVEHFVRATQAEIRIGGGQAFYDRPNDRIQMPEQHLFIGTETSDPTHGWYSTLLHELTHWSGASHRLNRVKGKRFGDKQYAFEELVAELGSAYLCADLGIANSPREDHAHYLKSWIGLLKDDNRAFFRAAAQAQSATNYLHQLQEDEKANTDQAVA